jgi:hypothetical protein
MSRRIMVARYRLALNANSPAQDPTDTEVIRAACETLCSLVGFPLNYGVDGAAIG